MRKSFLIVTGLFLITCNNTMKATANTVTTTPPISIASGSAILNSENNFNIDNLKDFVSEHFNIDEKTGKESILETKGKGFKEQSEFIERRNYIEKEFIKFNNKKFGYNKFDYLYIEDTLTDNEIISKLNDKLYKFLKEGK